MFFLLNHKEVKFFTKNRAGDRESGRGFAAFWDEGREKAW